MGGVRNAWQWEAGGRRRRAEVSFRRKWNDSLTPFPYPRPREERTHRIPSCLLQVGTARRWSGVINVSSTDTASLNKTQVLHVFLIVYW